MIKLMMTDDEDNVDYNGNSATQAPIATAGASVTGSDDMHLLQSLPPSSSSSCIMTAALAALDLSSSSTKHPYNHKINESKPSAHGGSSTAASTANSSCNSSVIVCFNNDVVLLCYLCLALGCVKQRIVLLLEIVNYY